MYAAFGGADFGGGIWTLLASGPRAQEQRESLFHAIGPVWETNHVWLIFVVVVLFTAFPHGFAALFTALPIPLVAALVGINLRGAAFAFRHFGRQTGRKVPLLAAGFEVASIATPCALGMAVAAVAGGRIAPDGNTAIAGTSAWLSPLTVTGGLIGMATCAYLAPIYMTVRTNGELQNDFRIRGMLAGVVLGVLTAVEIPLAFRETPLFAERLIGGRGAVIVGMAVAAGIATELLLWRRRYLPAQLCAAVTVALMLAGFGNGLYPDLLVGQLTIAAAAAPAPTLVAFLAILPFGALVLVPSLVLLYRIFGGPAERIE